MTNDEWAAVAAIAMIVVFGVGLCLIAWVAQMEHEKIDRRIQELKKRQAK